MASNTQKWIIGIMVLGLVLTGISIYVGIRYDFILIPGDDDDTDKTITPTHTVDPTDPTESVKPTISGVSAEGETLSKSSYTLFMDEEQVLVTFNVFDVHLIDRTNPINSEVKLEIFKKSDVDGTIAQEYVGTWSGNGLLSQCQGIAEDDFYINAQFSYMTPIVPGYEYQIEISATDFYGNTAIEGRWKLRALQYPGELTVPYWTPRENRWIDFEVHLIDDESVKGLFAFFKDGDGAVMKSEGETYYIPLALDFDKWLFTWDTDFFPNGDYEIFFLCQYGDTAIPDEEYKYEKEYNSGLRFQIYHEENTNTNFSVTAPGYGFIVTIISVSMVAIGLVLTKKFGDDEANEILEKTNP